MKRKLNIILFALALMETALYLNFDKVFVVGNQDEKKVQGATTELQIAQQLPSATLTPTLTTTKGSNSRGMKLVVDFETIDKNTDVDSLWLALAENNIEPTTAPRQVASYTTTTHSDVAVFIDKYSNEYGVDREMMVKIAKCESGFRAEAVNGPYAGIYQFLASTWSANRNAMGLDPDPALRFNAEESVRTAAFKMGRDGFGAWPSCSR